MKVPPIQERGRLDVVRTCRSEQLEAKAMKFEYMHRVFVASGSVFLDQSVVAVNSHRVRLKRQESAGEAL